MADQFKIELKEPKIQTVTYKTRAAAVKDARDYVRFDAVGTGYENQSKRGAAKWVEIFWFDSTGIYKPGGYGREIDRLENPVKTPAKKRATPAQLAARKAFAAAAKAGTLRKQNPSKTGQYGVSWTSAASGRQQNSSYTTKAAAIKDAVSLYKEGAKNIRAWKFSESVGAVDFDWRIGLRETLRKNPANRDDSIPGDFSQSSAKVLGRAWSDAKNASLKEHSDGETVVRLTWPDSEWLQMIFDTKAGALKTLTRLGFIEK